MTPSFDKKQHMHLDALLFKVFTAVFEFGNVARHNLPVGPWSEDSSLVEVKKNSLLPKYFGC